MGRLLLLFLSLLLPPVWSDQAADRAALLALSGAVRGRTILWNKSLGSPCGWAGVHCDDGRVTGLRLPGYALSGQIPAGTLGNLSELRFLSLRFNSLSGPLPPDLSGCSSLRNLNLEGNRFSGEIPPALFGIRRLVRLDLAHNNFSGPISSGFNNLTRMRTILLQNNGFVGSLPDLKLANLDSFNVSNNQLNGSVPSSFASFPATGFLGNSLCGPPLNSSCAASAPAPSPAPELPISTGGGVHIGNGKSGKKGLSGGAIAGIVIGSVVGILLIIVILFFCLKKSSTQTGSVNITPIKHDSAIPGEKQIGEIEIGGDRGLSNSYPGSATAASRKEEIGTNGADKKLIFFGKSAQIFDLEDLLRASAEVLGKGTFGTAYKALLEVGMVVAVKRLRDVISSEREFKEKIEIVGSMDHENLVPLRAYYYSRDEKLLVYDYMPMGSLSALLHGNRGAGRTPLSWKIRSGIALGAARGIAYLHARGAAISHGNIKSSNVLLTERSYDARVSDFGLAQLVGPPSAPARVAGYRAPEVTDPRKVSQKADVYSFGILALELLTGKAPTHAVLNDEGVDLPRWVQSVVREEWTSEVFDLELLRDQNADEMVQLLQLALNCTDPHPDKRPTMHEVVNQIEELRRSSLNNALDLEEEDSLQ